MIRISIGWWSVNQNQLQWMIYPKLSINRPCLTKMELGLGIKIQNWGI